MTMLNKVRRLGSDTAVYGIPTVLGRFLTFLLTPVYTNYITKAELGEVAHLYVWIAFVNVLFSFGLESAFFRFFETRQQVGTERARQECFSNAFLSIVVVGGGLALLFCWWAHRLGPALNIGVDPLFVRIAVLIALCDALVLIPYAALRMTSRRARFALSRFAVIVLNVLANVVLVVLLDKGITGIFAAGLFSSATAVLILLPEYRQYLRLRPKLALLGQMLRFGIPTIPAAVAAILLQLVDRPILKAFSGADAVGLYQANYRLAIPMMLFVTVFEYAWKPFFLHNADAPDARVLFARVFNYFVLACALVFLAVSFFIEYVVQMPFIGGRFVNPAYWSGLGIIPIVLGGYFFHGLYTNFIVGVYIQKKTSYLPAVTGAAAIANVAMNFALIPALGITGAAWATFGAYLLGALLLYRINQKIYPIAYEWWRVAGIILATLLLWFPVSSLTAELTPTFAIPARLLAIGALPGILALFGFFRPEELSALRRLPGRFRGRT